MVGLRERVMPVVDWIGRVVTQPRDELTRWQRAARFAYDLGWYGARQLREDRAPQMAAALAFRTLFSLMPIFVVATVLIRALSGSDEFQRLVGQLAEGLGLYEIEVAAATDGTGATSLGSWIEGVVGQAAGLNLAALGWIGVLVLVYSAVSLMVTIEGSFNSIYRAPEGRSWARRIPVYWFVLTFGSVIIAVTESLNHRVGQWIDSVGGWQWLLGTARTVWTFCVMWLAIAATYLLVPNARVKVRPVLIGAFITALLFAGGRRFLGAYFEHAVSASRIWGSLGLIPLFMFWVYLMWLLVLFGLEVSATLQALGGRRIKEVERRRRSAGLVDPAAVLVLMEAVAGRFDEGQAAPLTWLVDTTELPEPTVERLVAELVGEGYLHRVDARQDAVSLARRAGVISAAELMEIGYRLSDGSQRNRRSRIVRRLREAQLALASQLTLANLTPELAGSNQDPGDR